MDERLKNAIVKAAQIAGDHLRNPSNSKKSPYDIEKKCKELMLREIREVEPSISVFGEENKNSGGSIALCPLDSVVNFSREIGPYGAMAAYIENGQPEFGAVYLPLSEEMLTADRGKGARHNGRKISTSNRNDLKRAVVCCDCSSYDMKMRPMGLGAIEALAKNTIVWRNIGSLAAEFALLALGRIDGLIVPSRESAYTAGFLIIEEAGTKLTDGKGRPFSLTSANIVAASPNLHKELLDIVQGAL